jgi:hypothetical protein
MFKTCGFAADSLWFPGGYYTEGAGYTLLLKICLALSSVFTRLLQVFMNTGLSGLTLLLSCFSLFSTYLITKKELYVNNFNKGAV